MLRQTATRAPSAPRNSASIRSSSARSVSRVPWSALSLAVARYPSSFMTRSPLLELPLTADSVLVEDRHLAPLGARELIDTGPLHLEFQTPRAHDDFVDFVGAAQGRSDGVSRETVWGGWRYEQAHPVAVALPQDL